MKNLVLCAMVLYLTACKKDKDQESKPAMIYWGNAIYNPSDVTRDFSSYQSYPIIMPKIGVRGDVIVLQPKSTNNSPSKSFKDMIIGDTCYFESVFNNSGLCYLYNITSKVEAVFVTIRKIKLDTCSWGNFKLVRGSAILNDDNSVDLEYTDSIKDGSFGVNHYKIHYTK